MIGDNAGRAGGLPVAAVHRPGTEGLWTFVLMDMVIFLMIFLVFMGERLRHWQVYSASQLRLDEFFGLANTVILLSSSWMVVQAVHAARRGQAVPVQRWLGGAWLLGLLFCISKLVEYTIKIRAGITPAANSFFSFYFFITVAHFLHVLAGMVCIGYCGVSARDRVGTRGYVTGLENVGLFWHFVDVLWIFIFQLLYLVGRAV